MHANKYIMGDIFIVKYKHNKRQRKIKIVLKGDYAYIYDYIVAVLNFDLLTTAHWGLIGVTCVYIIYILIIFCDRHF